MDTTNALVTAAVAMDYLGIADETSADGIRMATLIDAVSHLFNLYTGRKLKAQALTEYYDGDGTDTLFLDSFPVNAVTSLHVDADRVYADADLVAASGYILYSAIGKIVLDDDTFPTAPQAVKIVYNAGYGYNSAAIPYDLQNACLEMIAYLHKRDKDGNLIGVSSISAEGVSTSYISQMPGTVRMVLDRYRRPAHG